MEISCAMAPQIPPWAISARILKGAGAMVESTRLTFPSAICYTLLVMSSPRDYMSPGGFWVGIVVAVILFTVFVLELLGLW